MGLKAELLGTALSGAVLAGGFLMNQVASADVLEAKLECYQQIENPDLREKCVKRTEEMPGTGGGFELMMMAGFGGIAIFGYRSVNELSGQETKTARRANTGS